MTRRPRPNLEALEDRIIPALTLTPTTFLDDGSTTSLRGDITKANDDEGSDTDTIQLQAGTYKLTIADTNGAHETANAQGDLNVNTSAHSLIIVGATDPTTGAPTTIIDQTTLDRVFQLFSTVGLTEDTVTFENLIIEGGGAQEAGEVGTLPGSADAKGGGILDKEGGNIVLSNVILQHNTAKSAPNFEALGGGIYMEQGSLTIKDGSVIQNNHAFGGVGGTSTATEDAGAAFGGGVFIEDTMTITDSTFSDNTVRAGADSKNGSPAGGGAIVCFGPTTITNSTLSGNAVAGGSIIGGLGGIASGGAIETFGPTIVTDSKLLDNTVTGGSGEVGADAQGGGIFAGANTTITGSTLSANILTGGTGTLSNLDIGIDGDVGGAAQGGAVYVDDKVTVDISSSLLSNSVLTGGSGSYTQTKDSVSGDVGGEAQGGAVYALGPTTISTSTLLGNTLTGGNGNYASTIASTGAIDGNIGGAAQGGGLYVSGTHGTATIAASTLSINTVMGGNGTAFGGSGTPGLAQGGGAYFAGAGDTLVNSTIADNQAIGGRGVATNGVASGGGLFFGSMPTGTPMTTITNVTVADNTTSLPPGGTGLTTGGGIDHEQPQSGQVVLSNTLVALNTANTGPDFAGAANSTDHNLIGNADGSTGFGLGNSGDLLGNTAKPLNPQLGPLFNNGGTTETLALLPGSPAINAGDNGAQMTTGPFDQRGQGFARVVDGTIDIGAFEVQPAPSSPPGSPPSGSPPGSPPNSPPSLISAIIGLYIAEAEKDIGFGNPTVLQATIDFDAQFTVIFGINIAPFIEAIADANVRAARGGG